MRMIVITTRPLRTITMAAWPLIAPNTVESSPTRTGMFMTIELWLSTTMQQTTRRSCRPTISIQVWLGTSRRHDSSCMTSMACWSESALRQTSVM